MQKMRGRVLLIGDIVGSYRSQNLVKILMDLKYSVGLVSRQFYIGRKKRPLIKKVIELYCELLFFLEIFIKAKHADVIYLLPLNYRYALIAYLAKLICKKPLISELYISAYDTARDRSLFKHKNSLQARYYRLLDKISIEKSDILIHLSKYELQYIQELVGAKINPQNIKILPLAIEPKNIAAPIPSSTFRVCWWGTFIPLHGLEKIIEAAKNLIDSGIDVRLDLFGYPGNDKNIFFSQMITKLQLENYIILHNDKTFINGKLEPFLQSHCDLALGIFGESEKAQKVIVNKIVDAFAMRLPVLTMDSTALSEFIDKDNELFTCPNTSEDIAGMIKTIMNHPEERYRRAIAGYKCYKRIFSIQNYSLGIKNAVESIMGNSN